ncbi:thiamine pyrophosphate-dependent enzyme [Puniceicoccus vermicola]|nr:thiamine pyrophosphate-dependent enzyme [Puniceicoccus vermicola]
MASPNPTSHRDLDRDTKLRFFRLMIESRMGDHREQSLLRQGHGWFHVGGIGHEAVSAIASHLEKDDFVAPYYRDRALVLARGMTTHDIALTFFGKRSSSSGGRQLPGHFSSRKNNIWSHPSPVGSHLLPACGIAWGIKLDGKNNVVVASTGEGASRQGDFFEAACVAIEKQLPVVFVVEDNGIAISTPNRNANPLALGVMDKERWVQVDGTKVADVYHAGAEAVAKARSGGGPSFLWLDLERGTSHSSADDHRLYRCKKELEKTEERDPIKLLREELLAEKILTEEEISEIEAEAKENARQVYLEARKADDPEESENSLHLTDPAPPIAQRPPVQLGERTRMLDAVNSTLKEVLKRNEDSIFYGQDIADPKGGVFRLTAGLSTTDPDRVGNSPIAESTIIGLACGLACYGKKPFFEIQFIDFIGPGWNQLANNLANLRWRSFGEWNCPAVIYAPYGAYLPGGAIWHSSSGEGLFANLPGLTIAVPSTPEDAAGLIWSANQSTDPVLLLLPKHLMWDEQKLPEKIRSAPIGRARVRRTGHMVTVVGWGNCIELIEESIEKLGDDTQVELIDLRTIVPWDRETVMNSVRKTGRLLIVQEDSDPCSVGQAIVSEVIDVPDIWPRLQASPQIISRQNTPIGFHPTYEYTALPDSDTVLEAIRSLVATQASPSVAEPAAALPTPPAPEMIMEEEAPPPPPSANLIKVPVLGEGITRARLLTQFKKKGESFEPDESICEVETDKAVFPIEAPEKGTLVEWLFEEGDDVGVGDDIARCTFASHTRAEEETSAPVKGDEAANIRKFKQYEAANGEIAKTSGLSAEIIQQMQGLVPATIMVKAKWEPIRLLRERIKAKNQKAPSPSAIVAWSLVQAMKKHRRFTHTLLMGKMPRAIGDFDLGVAVSLPDDRLGTAIVPDVNRREWPEFADLFRKAVDDTRKGRFQPKTRIPILLSTMGQYDVQSATPIVVPPSIATLFVGSAHYELDPESQGQKSREVVRLVLTFDHRWINGAGSASFLSEVKNNLENFDIAD